MITLEAVLASLLTEKYALVPWHMQLLNSWNTIVGPLAQKMCIKKIEGSTLIIGVYDPRWMHEFYMLYATILKSVNDALGHCAVKELKFTLIHKIPSPKKKIDVSAPSKECQAEKELPGHYKKVLDSITDVTMRSHLKVLFERRKR